MAADYRGTEVFHRTRARRSAARERPEHGRSLGVVALCAGLLTAILTWSGIATAMGGDFAAATTVAYVAIAASILAVLGGASALVLGRGRVWGFAAVLVGLVANPLVLTRVLGWASGLG